jgi:hypothetical protein
MEIAEMKAGMTCTNLHAHRALIEFLLHILDVDTNNARTLLHFGLRARRLI